MVRMQKAVHEKDFFDVDLRVYSKDSAEELNNENLTAYNQVETFPSRHVSFAETVEKVEFDGTSSRDNEYNAVSIDHGLLGRADDHDDVASNNSSCTRCCHGRERPQF